MDNYNNSNINDDNQTNDKKKSPSPTIGDAVKEAIETKKEVIIEGPAEIGDISEIEKKVYNSSELNKTDKEIDEEIDVSIDETVDSKIEINVKDPLSETPLNENRIIVNQENSEATIATVTTIPAEEGLEVEVQTEVEVPVKDKDKDIESDQKVLVHTPDSNIEVPLTPEYQNSTSHVQKETISDRFNSANQQSYNNASNEFQDNLKKNMIENAIPHLHNLKKLEKVQEYSNLTTKNIIKSYIDLQNQTIDSIQSLFSTTFESMNKMILNNQTYCTKIPETYLRVAFLYLENTVTINKILNDMTFEYANTFRNIINFSKENFKQ
jgi:hypothetical protein